MKWIKGYEGIYALDGGRVFSTYCYAYLKPVLLEGENEYCVRLCKDKKEQIVYIADLKDVETSNEVDRDAIAELLKAVKEKREAAKKVKELKEYIEALKNSII